MDPQVLIVTSAGAPSGAVVPVLAAIEAAGMRVRAIDVGAAGGGGAGVADRVVRALLGESAERRTVDELFAEADAISLHCPLTAETRHLVDARRLALMKPTAVLVNTARGPVVDEEALAGALHAGTIFAAGLDVFEREPAVHPRLLDAPGAVILPHIGSASVQTRTAMARMAVDAVVAVLSGRTPPNVIAP
jgi:glyoxylate reductase